MLYDVTSADESERELAGKRSESDAVFDSVTREQERTSTERSKKAKIDTRDFIGEIIKLKKDLFQQESHRGKRSPGEKKGAPGRMAARGGTAKKKKTAGGSLLSPGMEYHRRKGA